MNKIFTTLTKCVAALLCLLFIDQIVASAGIIPMLPGLNLPVLKNTATTKPTLLKGNAKRLLHAGFKYPGAVTSAPSISYSQPGIYSVGTPITPLSPVNIGGDVPAISYLQTSTIAGGFTGYVDSTGTNAKFNQPFGTASDASGNIYVADYGNNVIRKITPAGIVTTFAGNGTAGYANGSGSAAKFNGPIDLVIDASGNLYVADANNNMIRKITAQGMVTTVAGKTAIGKINGTSAVASFDHPHGITMDGAGNIFVADYNNNLIRKITSAGIVSTVAGSSSSGAVDGQGISASFYHPSDVAVDASGVLYVADNGNNTIRAISTDGVVSTFAGSASVGSSDGTGITARFNGPFSVVAYLGDIYVADNGNNEIRKINSAGEVQTIAGAVKAGSSDGIGTKATFNNVRGLAVDASGNMIAAAGTIRKISLVGYAISPVLPDGLTFDATTGVISGTPAGVANTTFTVTAYNAVGKSTASFQISIIDNSLPPSISYPSPLSFSISQNIQPVELTNSGGLVPSGAYGLVSDYPGTAIDYSKVKPYPRDPMIGLAIDSAGTLYVADHSLNVIRKVSTTGVYSILAGSGTAGSKNGTGAAASFSSPWSVALDRAGNTYVADEGNNLIRKVTPAGVVSTFAGSGAAGAVNDQGTAASFNAPHGIACDASGNLYVADYGNNLIRKITPTGMVTTLAGRGTAGSINGTGTAAAFKNPYNLTVDKSGNVFVTDYGNNIIRKITPDGIVSTLAGSGSTKPVNGTGTEAGFLGPVGITVDNKTGNVYVSDGNSYIRKITPSRVVTYLAGDSIAGHLAGIGTAARLGEPHGICIDANGLIYMADFGFRIRTITTTGYGIDKPLPSGVYFNVRSGEITGLPTALSLPTDYTISAYNVNGSSNFVINVAVFGPPPAPLPFGIHYNSPNTFTAGTPIEPLAPWITSGSIPSATYGQVNTLAGSTTAGDANGTGTAATLHSPFGTAVDAAGNVYFADFGNNLIRKISSSGVVSTVAGSGSAGYADGTGTAASFNNPLSVTLDKAGNIYVADGLNNMIRKITPGGIVSTLAGSQTAGAANGTGTAARFNYPHGIATDTAGNIFVADYSNNLIRKVTTTGVVTTVAGTGKGGSANGNGTAASFNGPYGIAVSASGNIYVTDKGNNLIRKISTSGAVTTLAGTGKVGAADGATTAASFSGPLGVAVGAGNVYISDAGNNALRVINSSGVVSTIAGNTTAGSINAVGAAARFNSPHGIALDTAGNLYVADYGNNQIRKVSSTGYGISQPLPAGLNFDATSGTITGTPASLSDATDYIITGYNSSSHTAATVNITIQTGSQLPDISYATPNTFTQNVAITPLTPANSGGAVPNVIFGQVSTFAGSGTAAGTNGTGTAAAFNRPYATATDGGGNIYIADMQNQLIRKISSTGVVTTFAGSGKIGSADGTGTAASFNNPSGIAVDAAGNVYVADKGNNVIRKITAAGAVTTFSGRGSVGSANGTGNTVSFNSPCGLAVDNYGNLIVGDYGNNLIRKITPYGVVTTVAGNGSAGSANGTAAVATFNGPLGVTVDASGNIYVADKGNNLIRKITPAGVVATLAGSGAAGSSNGNGVTASFNNPVGIVADHAGNVFVAEYASDLVRIITPSGLVSSLAGSGAGAINGTGAAASFNNPAGISIDGSGNLYVADYGNNLIRKVITRGFTINNLLPAGLTFNASNGVINGTPTTISSATDYAVTAYGSGGSSEAVVNIAVKAKTQSLISETAMAEPSVKPAMSPNGDGENDALSIQNIERYPANKLVIINKGGTKIFEISGYDNSSKKFDGHSNVDGSMQKAGTYYYVLDYQTENGLKHKTGYFLIKY